MQRDLRQKLKDEKEADRQRRNRAESAPGGELRDPRTQGASKIMCVLNLHFYIIHMHMYIVYVYIYIYTYVHTSEYTYIHLNIFEYIYIHIRSHVTIFKFEMEYIFEYAL